MEYVSTRGAPADSQIQGKTFEQILLSGVADDGGLYVPKEMPRVSNDTLARWRSLSYSDLAVEIISLFACPDISVTDLTSIVRDSASDFPEHSNWTTLVQLPDDAVSLAEPFFILELFHGPTLSFKDYAMTILGRLMNFFLSKRHESGNVLVATSGDTGSAAIAGFRNMPSVTCTVLAPLGRVSDIQRLQMTTEPASNVQVLLVEGTFDDCQRMLKESLADRKLASEMKLLAVNSVNFGRIACQIVYYFFAVFRVQDATRNQTGRVNVSVPTGNSGNILAGWYAKRMGCPIDKLIMASNVNDILPRFNMTGSYQMKEVVQTMSPSIDIQVSSNFERLIHGLIRSSVAEYFGPLYDKQTFQVDKHVHEVFLQDFTAASVTEEETKDAILHVFSKAEYLMDPHTAVGFSAIAKSEKNLSPNPMLLLATAHPSKFASSMQAMLPADYLAKITPPSLREIADKPERFTVWHSGKSYE